MQRRKWEQNITLRWFSHQYSSKTWLSNTTTKNLRAHRLGDTFSHSIQLGDLSLELWLWLDYAFSAQKKEETDPSKRSCVLQCALMLHKEKKRFILLFIVFSFVVWFLLPFCFVFDFFSFSLSLYFWLLLARFKCVHEVCEYGDLSMLHTQCAHAAHSEKVTPFAHLKTVNGENGSLFYIKTHSKRDGYLLHVRFTLDHIVLNDEMKL